MKCGRFKVSRRAVSSVVTTLLIIAIAVIASVIILVWVVNLMGGLMGSGGSQTKEQLIMESYDWSGSQLTFTLRNVGTLPVTVSGVYLGGAPLTTGASIPISVGGTAVLNYNPTGGSYTQGASYTLKVVSTTGGVFAYSVIDGSRG
jgi:flagellin-like protein